ncbi:translation elongation factor Ts [Candidatus Omnitrophota bacterium]
MTVKLDAKSVQKLREKTGVGMMDCKKALVESEGDFEKAIEYLRKKGMDTAKKKAGRSTKEGLIASYIHMGGKIAVLVEVNCETDFVAKNDQFQEFTRDIAMQVAAAQPRYVSRDDVPAEFLEKEKAIFKDQIKNKPENVIEKIIAGKVNKVFEDICLLEQAFIKDNTRKIQDYLTETIAKIGENISIKRFARFEVGEDLD